MSRNSMAVGVVFLDLKICVSFANRSSGMIATPTLGSTVENGELATSALPPTRALKIVDLPTLGKPIIPQLSAMVCRRGERRYSLTVKRQEKRFLESGESSRFTYND